MSSLIASASGRVAFSLPWNLSACDIVSTTTSIGFVNTSHVSQKGGPSTFGVVVDLHVGGIDVSSIVVSADVLLVVTALVIASGPCLPLPNFTSVLTFFCTLAPLRPSDALRSTTSSTFQSTTTVSSVTGNPMTALSNTGIASILGLTECTFSDVEQLETSISPIPFSFGDPVGQYYRGAIAVGVAMYLGAALLLAIIALALKRFWQRDDATLALRIPSSLLIVVGLFHQGMVTCGVSLIRIGTSSSDYLIGLVGIGLGAAVTAAVVAAMTIRLSCRIEDRVEKDKPLPIESKIPGLATLLKLTIWEKHWVDDGTSPGYKRRYLWLLDDLRMPWWSGVELSSGLVQGAILGVRLNDVDACRKQRVALLVHCVIMLALAVVLRPCGSAIGNGFLIAAKFCGAVVAVFIMVHTQTTNSSFATAASVVTTIFAFLSTVQAACQLVSAIVLGTRSFIPALRSALRKLLAEDTAVNSGGTTAVDLRTAFDDGDGGDELMRELLKKAEAMEGDELIDMLLDGSILLPATTAAVYVDCEGGEEKHRAPGVQQAQVDERGLGRPAGASHAEADDLIDALLLGGPEIAAAPAVTASMRHMNAVGDALLLPATSTSPPIVQKVNPFGEIEEKPRVNPFAQPSSQREDQREVGPVALQEASRRSSLGQFMSSGGGGSRVRSATTARKPTARTRGQSVRRPRGRQGGDPPLGPADEEIVTGGDIDFDSDFDDLLKDQKGGGQKKRSMPPAAGEKLQRMPSTQPISLDLI